MKTPEAEEPESADELPDLPPDSGDEALRILVDLTNKTDLEAGITLHLGGSLVSGTLVSLERHARGVAEALRSASPDSDGNEILAKLFEILGGATGAESSDTEPPEAEEEGTPPRCVHLRDARVIAPNGQRGLELPWWRGRIGAVSGWTMGSFTAVD